MQRRMAGAAARTGLPQLVDNSRLGNSEIKLDSANLREQKLKGGSKEKNELGSKTKSQEAKTKSQDAKKKANRKTQSDPKTPQTEPKSNPNDPPNDPQNEKTEATRFVSTLTK